MSTEGTLLSRHTLKNFQCIAANLVLGQAPSIARGYTYLANLPFRLVNDFFALRKGEYYKIALDVAAFTALFFPYGSSLAVAIDYFSELVQIYRQNGQVKFHTIKNVQCVLTNLAHQNGLLAAQPTYLANLPLRCCNDVLALREGNYYKVVLDIAAFTALFFPYGTSTAILIDYLAEIAAAEHKAETPPRSEGEDDFDREIPDCRTRAGALELLGLTEAEAQDANLLWQRYNALDILWIRKILNATSAQRRARITEWSNSLQSAYWILTHPK